MYGFPGKYPCILNLRYLNRKALKIQVRKFILPAILAMLSIFSPALAQETKVVRDMHLWTGAEIEKSFLENWKVSLKQEVRFKQNITEINNFFTQAGLRYRINKNFSLTGKYRYTRDRKSDGSYENRSRYSFDLIIRGDIDFITLNYRLRYQKEVESMHLFKPDEPYEKYLRHRIMVSYNDFKKIEPYISAEVFQLHELSLYPEFNWLRMQLGIRYEPGSWGELKFVYGVQRELKSTTPYTGYLFRINYTYAF